MEIFVFIGSLFALLITGIPVAFVLMLCAIILLWYIDMFDALISANAGWS